MSLRDWLASTIRSFSSSEEEKPPPPVGVPLTGVVDTSAAVAMRRLRADKRDTILGQFFSVALGVVKEKVSPQAADAWRVRAFGTRQVARFFHYPMADLLQILDELGQRTGSHADAIQAVGRAAVEPFFGSAIGRTMFALARQTPHDLIAAAPAGYRACTSWGTRLYTREGPRAALMTFEDDLLGPAWHIGVFPIAIKLACDIPVECQILDADDPRMNFTLRTSW